MPHFYAVCAWRVGIRSRFSRQKHRYVTPDRNYDTQPVIRAFRLIILAQFLTKAMDLYSGYSIFTGIEARGTVQYVDRDIVFLDLIGFARKILFTHVSQQICETW